MKLKHLLILGVLGVSLNIYSQEYKSAIGLRLGIPLSVTYKTFLNEKAALEFVAGYRNNTYWKYIDLGGYYEYHMPFPNVQGLKWYFGGGVNVFIWSYDDVYYANNNYKSTNFGIAGCIGLDYKFADMPLNLSVDWIPTFFISSDIYSGFNGGQGALAVRYVIK